jgi:hypothetical protein
MLHGGDVAANSAPAQREQRREAEKFKAHRSEFYFGSSGLASGLIVAMRQPDAERSEYENRRDSPAEVRE